MAKSVVKKKLKNTARKTVGGTAKRVKPSLVPASDDSRSVSPQPPTISVTTDQPMDVDQPEEEDKEEEEEEEEEALAGDDVRLFFFFWETLSLHPPPD